TRNKLRLLNFLEIIRLVVIVLKPTTQRSERHIRNKDRTGPVMNHSIFDFDVLAEGVFGLLLLNEDFARVQDLSNALLLLRRLAIRLQEARLIGEFHPDTFFGGLNIGIPTAKSFLFECGGSRIRGRGRADKE